MASDARGDSGIEADAGGEAVVRIGARGESGGDGFLSSLDFQAIVIAENDELAGALEIVMDTVNGGEVWVALVGGGAAGDFVGVGIVTRGAIGIVAGAIGIIGPGGMS